MDGQLRPGQRTAPEPDAADRACRAAVFRLEAEHPALGVGPAALEAAAFLRRTGTVECRLRQLLFPVAQKRRITSDAPAKSGAGQVSVAFSSLDQLDLICQRLSGEPI